MKKFNNLELEAIYALLDITMIPSPYKINKNKTSILYTKLPYFYSDSSLNKKVTPHKLIFLEKFYKFFDEKNTKIVMFTERMVRDLSVILRLDKRVVGINFENFRMMSCKYYNISNHNNSNFYRKGNVVSHNVKEKKYVRMTPRQIMRYVLTSIKN